MPKKLSTKNHKNIDNDVLLDDEIIIEKKNNKKKILSVVVIVTLLVLVIGVTYALYTNNFFSDTHSLQTGTVSIELLETTEVISISNALPMGDTEGKSQEDTYDFNVISEAAGDVSLTYNLYLEKLEVDPGFSELNDEEVKFYLTDESDNVFVGPTKISDLDTPFYSKTNIHSKTNTRIEDNFKIRVWIDEGVYPTGWEENPHQYKFKIGVKTGELTELECNASTIGMVIGNKICSAKSPDCFECKEGTSVVQLSDGSYTCK